MFRKEVVNASFILSFLFVGPVSSAADVPASPLSESQNHLLSNDQHIDDTGDHLAHNALKSGEPHQGMVLFDRQN